MDGSRRGAAILNSIASVKRGRLVGHSTAILALVAHIAGARDTAGRMLDWVLDQEDKVE